MPTTPRIRVVVQLPYDRPENPLQDPPHIEWNAEKANILWEVIALSRTSDNGGTDWKGLAAHLDVPLPYLLYRAQARYEEDLRGLKDIPGVLSHPTSQQPTSGVPPSSRRPSSSAGALPHLGAPTATAPTVDRGQSLSIRIPTRKISGGAASARTLTGSAMSATPLGVRLRLNSLTHKSPSKTRFPHAQRQGQARISSPTATLQEIVLRRSTASLRSPSPFSEGESSDSSDTSEVMRRKEEEEERNAEEREALDKKLAQLQKTMTTEMVGLVRNPPSQNKGKEKEAIRGRTPFPMPIISTTTAGLSGVTATGSPAKPRFSEDIGFGFRQEGMGFAPRNRDHSASVSSVSSPQGSVPSIPSPTSPPSPGPVINPSSQTPPHGQAHFQTHGYTHTHLHPHSQAPSLSTSPMARHIPSSKSSSPPVISAQNARGHAHLRTIGQGTGPLYGAAVVSEGESTQGSTASSFSDLSDASVSPSALESALMSNFRTGGSKMSTIARSRLGGRGTRQ